MNSLLREYIALSTEQQKKKEVREAKIGASEAYLKKERVREAVQGLIAGMVQRGEVPDQATLDSVFQALDMSAKALKMVPFEVWQRMPSPTPAPGPKAPKKGKV